MWAMMVPFLGSCYGRHLNVWTCVNSLAFVVAKKADVAVDLVKTLFHKTADVSRMTWHLMSRSLYFEKKGWRGNWFRGVFISRKLVTWHSISWHLHFTECDDVVTHVATSYFCGI